MRRLLTAAAVTLLIAGCGGGGAGSATGTESAATVAPAGAAGYVAFNTDFDSEQWKQVKELAAKFPDSDRLVGMIQDELGEEGVDLKNDVDPALGPETALVFLRGRDDPIVLTQPDDEAKLDALLEKSDEPSVTEEIEGWTAIAKAQADLDAFRSARADGTLADDDRFQKAVGDLPDEAVLKAYANGDALQDEAEKRMGDATGESLLTGGGQLVSVGAALEALDEGLKIGGTVRVEGARGAESFEPELLGRVPGDAFFVADVGELRQGLDQAQSNPEVQKQLSGVERLLGVTLDELGDLFTGESVVYGRPGAPIPEFTVLLDVDDEAAARRTLDRLAARVAPFVEGQTGQTVVDGVAARYLEIRGVRVVYATFDGLLAITTGPTGIREARSKGDKLVDDGDFDRAKDAAGLEDETSGFLYVNLRDSIPLVEGLAGIAGQQVPSEVSANLEPLDTLLVHAARDGDEIRFGGFLGIR